MEREIWHSDRTLLITAESYLTGNTVLINTDPKRFYVPEQFNAVQYQAAIDAFNNAAMKKSEKPCVAARPLLDQFSAVNNAEALKACIASTSKNSHVWDCARKTATNKSAWESGTSFKELLAHLWAHGNLLFPMEWPFYADRLPKAVTATGYACQMKDAKTPSQVNAWFIKRAMAMQGCASVLDIVPEVWANIVADWCGRPDESALASQMAMALNRIMSWQHAHAQSTHVRHRHEDYKARATKSRFHDYNFSFAKANEPAMEAWRSLAAKYYDEKKGIQRLHYVGNFLDYLIENPHLPRNPIEYFDVRNRPDPLYAATNQDGTAYVSKFLDWVADQICVEVNDDGAKVPMPYMANPLAGAVYGGKRKSQTGREPMPLLLVEKAIETLTANDWEWARNASGGGGKLARGNWYDRYDPDSNQLVRTWSPVTAVAVYVKLCTVFRALQVRYLDSGEADTLRMEISKADDGNPIYHMVPNRHALAPTSRKNPIARGVLQLQADEMTGTSHPILRISTNKTADTNKDVWERGYDCLWAPHHVIEKLVWLRNWQEKYNPAKAITRWKDVEELKKAKTDEVLKGMDGTFLFRDPAGEHPAHPVTYSRVKDMWNLLCGEVEKRLEAEGMVEPTSGTPYRLVLSRDPRDGRPSAAKYDLHTLRVTHITALYKKGVPIKVIMMIAGHATVVMSLYYTKYGVAEVKEILSEAEKLHMEAVQRDWANHNRNHSFEEVKPLLAFNNDEGVIAFTENQGLVFMDTGICPVGCAGCHEGVVKRVGKSGPVYGPVPGGRDNCAGCRFFISGPPFIHGLAAQINLKSYAGCGIAKSRLQAENKVALLKQERQEALQNGEPFTKNNDLHKAVEDFDRYTVQMDAKVIEMQNLATIQVQSLHILNNRKSEGDDGNEKVSLISGDLPSLAASFSETTEFDLVDRVCQASQFFGSVKSNEADKANLSRVRYFDRMLVRNKLQPAFLTLDEDTALRAGNMLTKLLRTRVGHADMLDLMEGVKRLQDLKLVPQDIYQVIENAGGPVQINRTEPPLALGE